MHQNMQLETQKLFLVRGNCSLPRFLPQWGGEYPLHIPMGRGYPIPHPLVSAPLCYWAFGTQSAPPKYNSWIRPCGWVASTCLIRRLQSAARLIFGIWRSEHISPHWLRVHERILFKIAITTYRALNGSAPAYLSSYFSRVTDVPSRQRLRSVSSNQLAVLAVFNLSTVGSANGLLQFQAPASGTVFHHT